MTPFRRGTALAKYVRLEALGSWRDGPEAAPREVVVALGGTTLVLIDIADRPLGHWSLAGIRVLRRDAGATIYAMTPEGYETLAIRDPEMIAAIAAVTAAPRGFAAPAPARRRKRWPWALIALAAAGALAWAAPERIRVQAAAMVPPERATGYAEEMLIQIIAAHGPLCAEPAGGRALGRLVDATAPGARVRILELGATPVALLPGGLILIDRSLPAAAESPEELAGWIALAEAAEAARPATLALMEAAGPIAGLRYILTGRLSEASLDRAATAATSGLPSLPPETLAALGDRLAAANLSATPLADGLRRTGAADAAAALLAAPLPQAESRPLLTDPEWAALTGICG